MTLLASFHFLQNRIVTDDIGPIRKRPTLAKEKEMDLGMRLG